MEKLLIGTFFILSLIWTTNTEAATCLTGSCHTEITASKFLHGPVAAEQAGGKGCVACHVPAGRSCSQGKKGAFKPMIKSVKMCQVCHSRGTGTQHSNQNIDCLRCHDPHGSDKSVTLQR